MVRFRLPLPPGCKSVVIPCPSDRSFLAKEPSNVNGLLLLRLLVYYIQTFSPGLLVPLAPPVSNNEPLVVRSTRLQHLSSLTLYLPSFIPGY